MHIVVTYSLMYISRAQNNDLSQVIFRDDPLYHMTGKTVVIVLSKFVQHKYDRWW